jgi:hypothetical protein
MFKVCELMGSSKHRQADSAKTDIQHVCSLYKIHSIPQPTVDCCRHLSEASESLVSIYLLVFLFEGSLSAVSPLLPFYPARNTHILTTSETVFEMFYFTKLTGMLCVCVRERVNPCGGGVEYLHHDPASRKRRRNGTIIGCAIA